MADFKCRHCGHSEELCQKGNLVQCLGCCVEIAEAAGHKCRWYGMCHSIYCSDCKVEKLNVWGYCNRLTHSIDGCRGCGKQAGLKLCEEQLCVNQHERKCQRPKSVYCLSCSKRLFDKNGQCPYCADKEVLDCVSCDVLFFAADLKSESLPG